MGYKQADQDGLDIGLPKRLTSHRLWGRKGGFCFGGSETDKDPFSSCLDFQEVSIVSC